jgi:hypothetical protein
MDPNQSSNEPLIGPCQNCGKERALHNWAGTMSALECARNPQHMFLWCERCCLEAQIEHARNQAARIPGLEAELAATDTQ